MPTGACAKIPLSSPMASGMLASRSRISSDSARRVIEHQDYSAEADGHAAVNVQRAIPSNFAERDDARAVPGSSSRNRTAALVALEGADVEGAARRTRGAAEIVRHIGIKVHPLTDGRAARSQRVVGVELGITRHRVRVRRGRM